MRKNEEILLILIILIITSVKTDSQTFITLQNTPNHRLLANSTLTESENIQALELWKIILKTRIDFIKSKNGYEGLLKNYGISLSSIYDHLNDPQNWIKLVLDFKNYSVQMKNTQLQDIAHSMEFLPSLNDIKYLISSKQKEHTDFIESWVIMVEQSNSKPWSDVKSKLISRVCNLLLKYGGYQHSELSKSCPNNNRSLKLAKKAQKEANSGSKGSKSSNLSQNGVKSKSKLFLKKSTHKQVVEEDKAAVKELGKMIHVLNE